MTTPASDGEFQPRRGDRILAFVALGLTIVSIVCFFAGLIARAAGADISQGIWPLVTLLPLIALPVAFLLILALLIATAVRRSRANRGSQPDR